MIRIYDEPTDPDKPTRYLLIYNDAVVVTGIDGLLRHYRDPNINAAVAVTPDGCSEPVVVEESEGHNFTVYPTDRGQCFETAWRGPDGTVTETFQYIAGFDNPDEPTYLIGHDHTRCDL